MSVVRARHPRSSATWLGSNAVVLGCAVTQAVTIDSPGFESLLPSQNYCILGCPTNQHPVNSAAKAAYRKPLRGVNKAVMNYRTPQSV